nr:MAG TPA: hypothetical protein [Bacteriophage sp.]
MKSQSMIINKITTAPMNTSPIVRSNHQMQTVIRCKNPMTNPHFCVLG